MTPWEAINNQYLEIISHQKSVLLKLGRRFVPTLTPDDILQPNDFLELENNPHFRYEEGVLAGIETAYAAFLALKREREA